MPSRIFSSVDLPAPLSPNRATTSPGRTVTLASMSALTWPNRLARCFPATAMPGGDAVSAVSAIQLSPLTATQLSRLEPGAPPETATAHPVASGAAGSLIEVALDSRVVDVRFRDLHRERSLQPGTRCDGRMV